MEVELVELQLGFVQISSATLQARSLGPWSSAVELVEARAAAMAARQGRLSDAAKAGIGMIADDSVTWSPKRDLALGPRPAETVPPLFQACLTLLVDYIEDVESLLGLPDIIKVCCTPDTYLQLSKLGLWILERSWPLSTISLIRVVTTI